MKTIFSFVLLLPVLTLPLFAQSNSISWHRIPGGGGTSQNVGWQLSGSIGPSLGVSGSGSFSAGYWTPGFVAAVTPTVQAVASSPGATPGAGANYGPTGGFIRSHRGMTLIFTGQPGVACSIQRSTNLVTWLTVWTTNAPPAGRFLFTDNFAGYGGVPPSSAYYRLGWDVPRVTPPRLHHTH